MSNGTPILPFPEDDDAAGDAAKTETDGQRRIDPDVNDDLVDSAEADRLAVESDADDEEDVDSP